MKTAKFSSREIAIASILLAMILIFVFVPLNFLLIDVAFIPLIAVIIACQVEGKKIGIFTATMFGFASLVAAFVRPNIFAPIFYNPLVSIIPRVIIGITCYFSYIGMQKLIKFIISKKAQKDISIKNKARVERVSMFAASTVSSMVAVITNTALVVSMIAAFNFGKSFGEVVVDKTFILSLLGVNFSIELAVCSVVTPPIVCALRVVLRKKESGYWLIAESAEDKQLNSDK